MIFTTLNKIQPCWPLEYEWPKLLASLGKTTPDDEPLAFSTIAVNTCVFYATTCTRSIWPEYKDELRLFAADCAESVLYIVEKEHPHDDKPRLAIDAARDFVAGKITAEEMAAASAAANVSRHYAGIKAISIVREPWVAAGCAARDCASAENKGLASFVASAALYATPKTKKASEAFQIQLLTERFS